MTMKGMMKMILLVWKFIRSCERLCDYHNTFQNVDSGVDILKSILGFNLRNSLEVISLLNARTVDPEEFLADLGFAEPDMRSRIPDRFLQGQSKAHGIDVDYFRRSLDQDDLYASLVRMCPRLDLEFIFQGNQLRVILL